MSQNSTVIVEKGPENPIPRSGDLSDDLWLTVALMRKDGSEAEAMDLRVKTGPIEFRVMMSLEHAAGLVEAIQGACRGSRGFSNQRKEAVN